MNYVIALTLAICLLIKDVYSYCTRKYIVFTVTQVETVTDRDSKGRPHSVYTLHGVADETGDDELQIKREDNYSVGTKLLIYCNNGGEWKVKMNIATTLLTPIFLLIVYGFVYGVLGLFINI